MTNLIDLVTLTFLRGQQKDPQAFAMDPVFEHKKDEWYYYTDSGFSTADSEGPFASEFMARLAIAGRFKAVSTP